MADVTMVPTGDGAKINRINQSLYKSARRELAFVSGDTVKSFTLDATAITYSLVVEIPNFAGASVTAVCSIENSDGVEIYASDALDENSTNVIKTERPLVGVSTVKITLSADPLSSGSCYVTIYVTGG